MMKFTKWKTVGVIAAMTLVLGACASTTAYKPASGPGKTGYSEVKIEPGKYRVSFKGNSSTELTEVENFILLRSAELTVADGLGHFMVLDESDGTLSNFRSTATGFGRGGFGRGGFGRAGFGGFGGGFGTTTSNTRERRAYDLSVIIQAFPGPKSEDNIEAFNAPDVIANLSPLAFGRTYRGPQSRLGVGGYR